ncbi:thymidine phosphorylase [bacterium]|nr:thymidine phosphorylase [bacterium]
MRIIDLIEKKKTGHELSEEEIKFFVEGVTSGAIEDYQTSALLMAIYFRGMTLDETTYLTKYMVQSGEILDLSDISDNVADKHSTGGVGDKITLMFMPIMAAAGVYLAKLSGRGLGHTGGTIDKLESIPGFNTALPIPEFKAQIKKLHTAIAAQTLSLCPADGKLYALRDVTSTVDIIPLIASSVVSKKIASGANHIVLDVKCGKGAFIKTPEDAEKLSNIMVEVGKRLNRNISAVISSMDEPLGHAVGNAVEVQEVIEFLKGNMCEDLKEITFTLAEKILKYTHNFSSQEECRKYLEDLVMSGRALEKFREIIKAQGGDDSVIDDYLKLGSAKYKYEVKSHTTGYIKSIDALKIAKACKLLGAGRDKKSDDIDHSAGIYLNKKSTDFVNKEEVIATILTNKENVIEEAKAIVSEAFQFDAKPVEKKTLIYKIIN